MARLNIEEQWWSDPRRMRLILKIGFAADSAAVNMWRTAQEFWGRGRGLIPKHVFDSLEFAEDLLGVCLAEARGDMVYVRGSSAFLDWHAEKREAAKKGGKVSAKRPRNAKGQLTKTSKQSPSKVQAEAKVDQASDSDSDSDSGSGSLDIAPAKPAPNPVGVYCEVYKKRYGHNPPIGDKQAGILARFAKSHSSSWEKLMRGYLSMPDSWAVQRSHPVELLESKVNEITRFLETGKIVTRKVVEHAEEMIDRAQGTHLKPRRSIAEIEAERDAMLADARRPAIEGVS